MAQPFLTNQRFDRNCFEVFTISFVLFFLETLYFKTSIFVLDYLNALLIISYAMLGLGIGAIASHRIGSLNDKIIGRIKSSMLVLIALSFVNFAYFANWLFFSPLLILPFALGNMVIAHYLRTEDARRIYLVDLVGATLGVLLSLVLIPLLREENCFLAIMALLSYSSHCNDPKRKKKDAIPIITLTLVAFLCINLATGRFNLVNITRCVPGMIEKKVFCWGDKLKVAYSRGSNVQRIDAFTLENQDINKLYANYPDRPEEPNANRVYVAFDGQVNDRISLYAQPYHYIYDPRIVRGLVSDPHFLLIGASAEGVVKTATANVDNGKITAVELNPQIVNLMRKHYRFDMYRRIDDLRQMDGRTFLDSTPASQKFDIITLMNIHLINDASRVGPPESLHTYEGINAMFDHLSERGFIIFEERLFNEQGEFSSLKILNTILQVMKDRGFKQPEKHLFVYRWQSVHIMPEEGSNQFSMLMVKNTPFSETDWLKIEGWKGNVKRYFLDDVLPMYPKQIDKSRLAGRVQALVNGTLALPEADLSPVTDDKPFPWSVYRDDILAGPLTTIASICLILLLAMSAYWLKTSRISSKADFARHAFYFSLIGLGYFIIEVGLINFYQALTGSPTYTFIFVLATLLFSSGIGSHCSRRFGRHQTLLAFAGLLLLCLYHVFINRPLIAGLGLGPLTSSFLIGLSILPLGFCMGIPFPTMLEQVKSRDAEQHIPFFFALNCLFSTFAVFLSYTLSVRYGLKITFLIGVACYVAPLLICLRMRHADAPGAQTV